MLLTISSAARSGDPAPGPEEDSEATNLPGDDRNRCGLIFPRSSVGEPAPGSLAKTA
ncbi:hypothetical protein [Streptomyces sp. F001]|uniref:hypothetical protein n=1 Tax=Streptomyces sp. F001 TaxID=1510026 RepID=UPI0013EE6B51|nr:hypothetical protein [Streptomyces sp. F001]